MLNRRWIGVFRNMDKTLRIGVIGIGGMGNHHINSYQDIPNVEIVALCDIVPEKARTYWGEE